MSSEEESQSKVVQQWPIILLTTALLGGGGVTYTQQTGVRDTVQGIKDDLEFQKTNSLSKDVFEAKFDALTGHFETKFTGLNEKVSRIGDLVESSQQLREQFAILTYKVEELQGKLDKVQK